MNSTNFWKNSLITILILAIALVLLFTVGFNKSFDFTGGTIVEINATTYNNNNEAQTKISNVLHENQITNYTISQGEINGDTILVVKYQINKDIEATNENVKNNLYSAFNYNKTDPVEENYIYMVQNTEPAYNSFVFVKAFLAVITAIVACAIYMFARGNIVSAFTMIAKAIIDIGLMLSLVIILRIDISAYISLAIIGTTIISIITSYIYLSALNTSAKDEKYKKSSNKQIVDDISVAVSKKIFFFAVAVIVALLLLYIVAGRLASSSVIALAFGTIACLYTSLFATPNLWSMAFVRRVKQPKIKNEIEVEEE